MKMLRAFILGSYLLKAVFYRFSGAMASYLFVGCLLFLMAPGTAVGQLCMQPDGNPNTPLIYHCGPILNSINQTTHVILINPNGNSIPDNYKIYLEEYLQDVGDTQYLGMVVEYGGSGHSSYGGEWSSTLAGPWGVNYYDSPLGTKASAPNNISLILDEALQNNRSWNTGASDEYFVLLPPNATVCVPGNLSCSVDIPSNACGYHGVFSSPSRAATIYYAVIGYGCTFNGVTNWPGPDAATTQSTMMLAHEQLEMITDPENTGWWDTSCDNGFCEVMDKCRNDTDWQQRADGTNVRLRFQSFLLPKMWSNVRNSCLRPGPWGQVKNPTQEIGLNTNGTLEIFGLDSNTVWHDYQQGVVLDVPGSWSGWYPLIPSCSFCTNPAVGTNADGRLEVFYVGPNLDMLHAYQAAPSAGPWYDSSLGGTFQSNMPAIAANADGRLEVFALGTDGQTWHNYQVVPNGGWAGWSPFSAPWSWPVAPTVGINADGRLELFQVAPDGTMYHLWQAAPSSGPWDGDALPGQLFQTLIPAVATNADGRLEVFALGVDNQVYHNYQVEPNGGWQGWSCLCAPFGWAVTPRVGINGDGRLEVFMPGPDSAMWHLWQNSPSSSTSWGGGSLGGGVTNFPPAVATNPDYTFGSAHGILDVYAIGFDGGIWHNHQVTNPCCWSGWIRLPDGPAFSQM